jgi:RHS repeat-associated protein
MNGDGREMQYSVDVVAADYSTSGLTLDLWGGTSGTFNGLDRFNRIIDQRWTYNGTDVDRYKYGYDRNSNRQWKENTVSKSIGSPVYLDEYYTYDDLNRLTDMKRGQLTGGPPPTGIGGTPGKEQAWTLDKTGNWSGFVTKTSGTTDLNQTRTSNVVNEITAISESVGTSWPDPTYDAAGNTITMPQPNSLGSSYTAVYDAWNRMVSITSVAQYAYDGLGRRIMSSTSETRYFYWSKDWQNLEERVGIEDAVDTYYIYGTRYVDELLFRGKDEFDDALVLQDANYNVTSIWTNGAISERYVFYPYGERLIYDASWSPAGPSSYNWLIGHQGLMHDQESGLIYNRTRYVHALVGRFGQRDTGDYLDDTNLYAYLGQQPLDRLDPQGLAFSYGGKCGHCTGTERCCSEWKPYWEIANYLDVPSCVTAVNKALGATPRKAAIIAIITGGLGRLVGGLAGSIAALGTTLFTLGAKNQIAKSLCLTEFCQKDVKADDICYPAFKCWSGFACVCIGDAVGFAIVGDYRTPLLDALGNPVKDVHGNPL